MNVQTKNTLCSVLQHITAIVCGLILPREILSHYGSEMNGMVHSISQFLSYTVLLEMGIGAVIPAALYQPLEAGDFDRISAILSSGYRVFRRIAGICTVYILLLTAVFPAAAGVPSSAWFILVLGLGTVIHYQSYTEFGIIQTMPKKKLYRRFALRLEISSFCENLRHSILYLEYQKEVLQVWISVFSARYLSTL